MILPQRPLPRQLVASRGSIPDAADAAADRPELPHARRPTARRSCPTRATTASRGRGRSRARPGLAHRIGGLEKQDGTGGDLLRRRQPPAHDRPARGEGRRRRRAAPRGRRRRGRRPARDRLGLELRRHPRRRAPRPRGRRTASRSRTSTTSTRCPPNTGEVLRAYERVLLPEMNIGPARARCCAPSSSSTSSATRRSRASRCSPPRSRRRS